MIDTYGLLLGVIIVVVLYIMHIWILCKINADFRKPRIFYSLLTGNVCLNLIEDTREFIDLEYFCEFKPASTLEVSPWPGLDAVCLEADNVTIWYLAANWHTDIKKPLNLIRDGRITHQISVRFSCGNYPFEYLIYLREDLSFLFRSGAKELVVINPSDYNYKRAGDLFHKIHEKSSDMDLIPG